MAIEFEKVKEFEKEDRYLVVKYKDIHKYLSEDESGTMFHLVNSLFTRKFKVTNRDNHYIVVNENEPYAEKVWQLIKEQWEAENGLKAITARK